MGVIGCVVALTAAIGAPLVAAPPAGAAVLCQGRPATIVGTDVRDFLSGTPGSDVIAALGGNDVISGAGGNDVICGNAGDDQIDGGADQDQLYGGPGNDTIVGGPGVDTVSYVTSPVAVVVDIRNQNATGEGSDRLTEIENVEGSQFDDRLFGDAQANLLAGLNGSDLLVGAAGNDVLAGGGPNPKAINDMVGGAGDDLYIGGVANDMADFHDITGSAGSLPVVVNLVTGVATGQGNDLLSGVDSVNGTVANDTITGDAANNTLNGNSGNDTIAGGGGADTLQGDLGSDILDGGAGTDRASFASAGGPILASLLNSVATGAAGVDELNNLEGLVGGPGNDELTGTAGNNTIEGLQGDDIIDGLGGIDWALFDSATTPVIADLNSGRATSMSTGNDTLASIENLRGGASWDVLRGNNSANTLVVGLNDEVEGRGGDDVFTSALPYAEANATFSYASAPGGVTVDVTAGVATGAAGNDTFQFFPNVIVGSNFDDRLGCSLSFDAQACTVLGRGGNDTIVGTIQDDTLNGGLGNDLIDGFYGYNVADFEADQPVNVNLATGKATGQGNDTLTNIFKVHGSLGNDTIVGNGGVGCELYGGSGDDNISTLAPGCDLYGGNGNDTITGSNGNDFIDPDDDGSAGNDTVRGGAGHDVIRGDTGNDNIDGGTGVDILTYADDAFVPLQANLATGVVTGLGNDTVAGFEYFTSGSGNDTIRGNDGFNAIDGGDGNDTIFGAGGGDWLVGGNGNDWMDGNAGDDLLSPGHGNDQMYGEDGGDLVSWADSDAAVTVDMASGQALGDGFDHFAQVEDLNGSRYNDVLTGDAGPNHIDGNAGTDICTGGGGVDFFDSCP